MNKIATLNHLARLKAGTMTLLMFFLLFSSELLAQINYSQGWNTAWSTASWSTNWSQTTSLPCEGSGAVRKNIFSAGTAGAFLSPDLGATASTSLTLNYNYKITNWSAGTTATANTFGSIAVQYSSTSTGPWTTIETINNTNHIATISCTQRTVTFTPPSSSSFFIRLFSLGL